MARGLATGVARLVRATQQAYERKWSFLAFAVLVFALSLTVLSILGLTPDSAATRALGESDGTAGSATQAAVIVSQETPEVPVKVTIPAIGLSAIVANPSSTQTAILDTALLKGAVRYPTSAKLGQAGNVVLFGHSSYLPIVNNPAYKTFNGIQKLHTGDTIVVYSSGRAYVYAVRAVAKESAASDAGIPLDVPGRVLTLSTCDSFGEKTDRFVVTADFVESHSVTAS